MSSTITRSYRVAEGVVHITVKVGDGQAGASTVKLGGKTIAEGEFIDKDVGLGPVIAGKALICTTWVEDVQPQTDHTSVTYNLTGGVEPKKFVLQEDVDPDGTIVYLAVFTFTK